MKKALVVATSFYPENAIGAVRTTKMIKDIVNMGWEVTIITPKLPDDVKIDETLFSKEITKMNKHIVDYSNIFKRNFLRNRNKLIKNKTAGEYIASNSTSLKSKIIQHVYRTGYFFYNIIRNNDWNKQVIKYYKKELSENKYDVLITTYPSLSSHLVGLYMKKNNIVKKWIADFQDPIAYEVLNTKLQFKFNTYLQKKVCKAADAITAVTQELLNKLNSYTDKPHMYIPMSFDYDDISSEVLNVETKINMNSLNFTYVGSLYGGKRDLSVIFEAINHLYTKRKIKKSDVCFNYAGNEFGVLFHQAKTFNCEDILNNIGVVNRRESIKLQQLSDVNVIITWNTKSDKGVIPGKLYEAFLVKRSIIALILGTDDKSELKDMIKHSGLGEAYEIIKGSDRNRQTTSQISDYILKLYEDKVFSKKTNIDYDKSYVESFEHSNITKKLVGLMDGLLEDSKSKAK